MKKPTWTESISVIALIFLLVMVSGIYIQTSRAQPATVTSGFWFMRKPPTPPHIEEAARIAIESEINRLTLLSAIPLDDPHVTDYAGNPITWDQLQLDAVNARIAELQLLLNEF